MTATATPTPPTATPPDRAVPARARDLLAASPALLVAFAVAAALVGVAFSGAAAAVLLGDPGGVVRWGLPVVSSLTRLAAAMTTGGLVLVVAVLPRPSGGASWPAGMRLVAFAAATWTVLAVAELVFTYGSVAGRPLSSSQFGSELSLFATQVGVGRALLGIVVAVAVLAAVALVVRTPTGAAWTSLLAVAALWLEAGTGHAAGAANHELATGSLMVHLVGAAVWVGGLGGLAVLNGRLGDGLGPAVRRYSVIAGWCLVGVGLSGVVNGIVRLGGWSGLGTRYGVLILTKAALLGTLGLLGLAHRRVTIPRIGSGGGWPFWRLVLVELVVMGAVSGVAVALAGSAPPLAAVAPADPTPAYLLTGHQLPPALVGATWFTQWRVEPITLTATLAGLVVYLRWAHRLRARGDAWPWARTASWVVGLVVFGWTTNGGPNVYGHVLFSAHMVQHMVLVMVVPVLIVLAAPVTLALRALPARAATAPGDDSRGPREWLLALVHSRVAGVMSNPVVAAVNFAGSMIVFYYSDVFGWALRTPEGHLFMVVHFSLAGYLFANALIGIDPGPRRPPYAQRLLLLFATMAFHAFFGVTLMSGNELLVAEWFGLMGRTWGPSALADQRLGGSIAWGIGELPTLALAVGVAMAWARDDERVARRRDRRVEREGDVELDEYNAMLTRLADHDTKPDA
ncbi:MAG: copper resistance protein CopD [Cellulomonas sp. 73-92]|uniref:bifunctional copper resistance protein CopD/cytochrome c oxidase assembly protein n=1 Tax=Cellulomonas sp. 73-92 TaxID=1895740 RepID=UPI000928BFA1|nr:bifunctional copper resistance protein CopD/cytochrome c oxidase assembly protein [Cellulomonas sp. 73-92]OJV80873.1 MAG: copper resistance protein CopD [Cellulomonas sp. 73-92]